ncbi:DUF547 domain-containing protein [Rheinheimera sp.]|uniref:DUF547 domain-containing protein n=1 Tax=Rheinheimera sp. TaxID=1869214 RepID=UPI0027BA386B|nr:DUF547 domain-containing protein [Rheinheimera sp.]
MEHHKISGTLVLGLLLWMQAPVAASPLPASFIGATAESKIQISYDDLDALLRAAVLPAGPANRDFAAADEPGVNSRIRNQRNVLTHMSAARFQYEGFRHNEKMRQLVKRIRAELSAIPDEIALNELTKDEQLAYWLNLYNITVLDELIQRYPQRNLQQLMLAEDGLLQQPLLTISGIKLSLDDIQFKVLPAQFGLEPKLLYGLYQGYIGSPSISSRAYTGANVQALLQQQATEFIQSNRGTYPGIGGSFRVSGFYQRSASYFPDFQADLTAHLAAFLPATEKEQLQQATELKADITDYSVTDLYGTLRQAGGGAATSDAALLDSAASTIEIAGSQRAVSHLSPAQIKQLQQLNLRRLKEGGNVTVTDLPETQQKTNAETDNKTRK